MTVLVHRALHLFSHDKPLFTYFDRPCTGRYTYFLTISLCAFKPMHTFIVCVCVCVCVCTFVCACVCLIISYCLLSKKLGLTKLVTAPPCDKIYW